MNDKLLDRNCVLLDGACKCRRGHLFEDCKYSEKKKDYESGASDKEWDKQT